MGIWQNYIVKIPGILVAAGYNGFLYLHGSGPSVECKQVPARVEIAATATLTVAQLLSRKIWTTGAAATTLTLPASADIVAALFPDDNNGLFIGWSFEFAVCSDLSTSNNTTVAAGTGQTLVQATNTIAQTRSAIYQLVCTGKTRGSETFDLVKKS